MTKFGRSKTKRGRRRARMTAVTKLGLIAQGGVLYHPQTMEDVVEGRDPDQMSEQESKAIVENLEMAAK